MAVAFILYLSVVRQNGLLRRRPSRSAQEHRPYTDVVFHLQGVVFAEVNVLCCVAEKEPSAVKRKQRQLFNYHSEILKFQALLFRHFFHCEDAVAFFDEKPSVKSDYRQQ